MNFFFYLSKERNRLFLETVSTAIGVLVALTIDSVVDFYHEKNTFHSMLHSIQVEARDNQVIFEKSFKPNFENAIVYRSFNLKSFEQYWENTIFVEHASKEQISILSQYYLSLSRSNSLREAGKEYAYNDNLNDKFGNGLRKTWKENLTECEAGIKAVLAIQNGSD